MTSWRRALAGGVLVWLAPFLVACAAFPLKRSWPALFESIMPVALALTAVVCGLSYLRRVRRPTVREGLALGLLWQALSMLIDLPLLLSPPMNYSLAEYAADIGLTYVMLPVTTAGLFCAAARNAGPAAPPD